jgi:DNA-binding NarL/FixJ family response regulator
VRVFLVDEHPMFRAGVRLELERSHDLELAGEAATEEEAVRELHHNNQSIPDVIVADLPPSRIWGGDFIRTVGKLSEEQAARILIVSITESDEAVIAAMSAGARGFLGKTVPREHLILAIRLVAAGGAVFSPAIAQRMQSYFSAFGDLPEQSGFSHLTLREREVLDLLARGCGNREIARRLVLAEKTVRNHVSHIFAKLNVRDRAMAVVLARSAGIGA